MLWPSQSPSLSNWTLENLEQSVREHSSPPLSKYTYINNINEELCLPSTAELSYIYFFACLTMLSCKSVMHCGWFILWAQIEIFRLCLSSLHNTRGMSVGKSKRSQDTLAGAKPSKSPHAHAADIELVQVLGMQVLSTFYKVQENID